MGSGRMKRKELLREEERRREWKTRRWCDEWREGQKRGGKWQRSSGGREMRNQFRTPQVEILSDLLLCEGRQGKWFRQSEAAIRMHSLFLAWLDKGITFGWKPSFLDLVSSAVFFCCCCCCCCCCLARSFSSASICICSERIRIRIWWIATKWTEQKRERKRLEWKKDKGIGAEVSKWKESMQRERGRQGRRREAGQSQDVERVGELKRKAKLDKEGDTYVTMFNLFRR